MAANFYGSPIRGTVAEVNIEDSLVGNESSVQQEVERPTCCCKGTCSKRSGRRPGCPCKDANLKCIEQCQCGKKSGGTVVKWCSNGKPGSLEVQPAGGNQGGNRGRHQQAMLTMEQEIELAKQNVQDLINDLTLETLQRLTIELAVIGAGSLEYVRDLLYVVQHPQQPIPRPDSEPWCKCGICVDTGHPDQNKCCDRRVCVTSYKMFQKLCLDKDVLQLNITARCDIRADPMDYSMNSFRKAAYRQFALWKYGRLGKGNRRILPSCVVKIVREAYPSPDGQYMGFKRN